MRRPLMSHPQKILARESSSWLLQISASIRQVWFSWDFTRVVVLGWFGGRHRWVFGVGSQITHRQTQVAPVRPQARCHSGCCVRCSARRWMVQIRRPKVSAHFRKRWKFLCANEINQRLASASRTSDRGFGRSTVCCSGQMSWFFRTSPWKSRLSSSCCRFSKTYASRCQQAAWSMGLVALLCETARISGSLQTGSPLLKKCQILQHHNTGREPVHSQSTNSASDHCPSARLSTTQAHCRPRNQHWSFAGHTGWTDLSGGKRLAFGAFQLAAGSRS